MIPGGGPIASGPIAASTPEPPFDATIFDVAIFDAAKLQDVLASADWTGISERLASDPEKVAIIRAKIEDLDRLVETVGLSNSSTVEAKEHTKRLLSLVSEPRPRWREIADLLTSPFAQGVYGGCVVEAALFILEQLLR